MRGQVRVDGGRLLALREARGWSKKRLAREAGVDYSTYWRIESGQAQNPRIETIQRVARALDSTVEDLTTEQPLVMHSRPVTSGTLSADGDAEPQLAEVSFFGLVSELGTLTDAERAAVLPVLREIVSRRRASPGSRDAGGRGGGAATG